VQSNFMLAIRMQRTGRKGHSQFRVVVQDSQFSPSSGRVVAYLGSYNPHSKTTTLDKQKVATYLKNGARPSERVVKLLKNEGVDLPGWVATTEPKARAIRNQDKLRRNRPAEQAEPKENLTADAETVEPTAEVTKPEIAEDVPAEQTDDVDQNSSKDIEAEPKSASDSKDSETES
jgi:small subunit ribosomal protein S16